MINIADVRIFVKQLLCSHVWNCYYKKGIRTEDNKVVYCDKCGKDVKK